MVQCDGYVLSATSKHEHDLLLLLRYGSGMLWYHVEICNEGMKSDMFS